MQRWHRHISGKPSFSLALIANEQINDGHAQRKSEASQALASGTTVSRRIWSLPGAANHTHCNFSIACTLERSLKQSVHFDLHFDSRSLEQYFPWCLCCSRKSTKWSHVHFDLHFDSQSLEQYFPWCLCCSRKSTNDLAVDPIECRITRYYVIRDVIAI